MKRRTAWTLAIALMALLLAGCLEFDGQTLYFEYDAQNDRLLFVLNYVGLYHCYFVGLFGSCNVDVGGDDNIDALHHPDLGNNIDTHLAGAD